MNLKQRITADFMAAFKAKQTEKKNFLGLIKSTIDNEEKKIRIIKPIFEENGQKVIDVSVLISVKDNQIVWNR